MLSLAKLSALASEEDEEQVTGVLDNIEHQMNVIETQEQLPNAILEGLGFERETMRALTPRELIEVWRKSRCQKVTNSQKDILSLFQLYISEDNAASDQIDFKKALDLLEYELPASHDEDGMNEWNQLKLHIWAR